MSQYPGWCCCRGSYMTANLLQMRKCSVIQRGQRGDWQRPNLGSTVETHYHAASQFVSFLLERAGFLVLYVIVYNVQASGATWRHFQRSSITFLSCLYTLFLSNRIRKAERRKTEGHNMSFICILLIFLEKKNQVNLISKKHKPNKERKSHFKY